MDSMDSMPFSSEVSLPHQSLKCKWKQNNWPNEEDNKEEQETGNCPEVWTSTVANFFLFPLVISLSCAKQRLFKES